MTLGRLLRIVAAIALLIGGLIHLQLYFKGYRNIDKIGTSFVLNAIGSGVIAAAVAWRREPIVKLAGIGLAVGTLIGFFLSRQGDGLFDFREQGLQPSPQAALALVVEIGAIVLLAASLVPKIARTDESEPVAIGGIGLAVSAVALIGLGAFWASDYGTKKPTLTAAPTTTVATADTTAPGATTIPGATTVPGDTTAPAGAPAGSNAITISDFSFGPATTSVPVGTTVTWTNGDPFDHSVVSGDKTTFRSDPLGNGDTFEFTFDTPGDFAYICGIHPSMQGTITVTG
jgi:plastocyanin